MKHRWKTSSTNGPMKSNTMQTVFQSLVGTKLDLRHDSEYVANLEAKGKRVLKKEEGQEVANQIGAKLH